MKIGNCLVVGEAAQRPYTISGMWPQTRKGWEDLCRDIPRELNARITSGLRTYDDQKRIYDHYNRIGQRGRAAPPGTSQHEYGWGFDFDVGRTNVHDWLDENDISRYGLHRPVSKERWHIEHLDGRKGNVPVRVLPPVSSPSPSAPPLPPVRPDFLGNTPQKYRNIFLKHSSAISSMHFQIVIPFLQLWTTRRA